MASIIGLTQKTAPAPADALVRDSTIATFVADVIEPSMRVPVLVDFWAPWCGPCKQLGPLLEKIVRTARGAVQLVKIDIDQNPALAQQMRIQSIPAVYAFFQGQPVDGFMGALPESELQRFVDRLLKLTGQGAPGAADSAALLTEADAALASGKGEEAALLYQDVLGIDPAQPQALAGLVRALLVTGNRGRARQVLDQVPTNLAQHSAIGAARQALELAEQLKPDQDPAVLRARLAAAPTDYQLYCDLALAYLAQGQKAEAVGILLEAIRRDRTWNEQAARKQLLQLFDAFGPTDPLTIDGRKRLSAILFS